MGDVQQDPNSDKPPHPGSAWQQLFDPNTGYPYYWNIHNNQVRWDVPPEFVQYQQREAQAKKAAEAERNAAKANNNGIAALVSAYSDDSDDDKAVEVVKEKQTVVEVEDDEAKPDFIGPVIPKPSMESESEKEVQVNEEEPAPPGENDEDELTLLRKLQEKSAALAKMGGDISKEVKEIIDPDHLAKIEEDIAADIMSQIEAEEPPDYKAEDEVNNVKEPSPPLPEDPPPPLPSDPPPLPSAPLPPAPPEEPTQSTNPISLLSCSYGGESDEDEDEDSSKEELKHAKGKGHLLPAQENLGNIFYKAGAGWGQTEEQKVALESFYVETAIEDMKNDKEKPKVEKMEVGRGRKRRLELPSGRFNKLEQGPEEKEQKVVESKVAPMAFVKSTGLPGTIEDSSKETISDSNDQVIGVIDRGSPSDGCQPDGERITNGNSRDGDISNMAEELVDKLECFKVGQEKISSLKMLAVKIETLYGAWTAGALTPQYLTAVLNTVASSLTQAEVSLNRPPWTAVWDRTAKRYNYRHILTGEVRESSPGPNSDDDDEEEEADSDESPPPPPPLPPAEEDGTPPPPPPQSTSPPPATRQSTTPTADHQLQDMDIDDDEMTQNPLSSITEEMASFYSDLATLPPTEDSPPAPALTTPAPPAPVPTPPPAPAIIDHLPQLFQDDTGSGSSRSSSPVPLEKMAPAKKRKKPKVSSSLALKKKGVGGMLEKWQNLQS